MAGKIEGSIVSVDSAGNLVSDIPADQLADAPTDDRLTVACGGHETLGIFQSDHSEPESTLLALIGQSGNLEIGIVGVNLSQMLGLNVGEKVIVKWD